MINEELYIITGSQKQKLDLPSPSGITLKWVSNLFNDISKLTCSYSYTFKLPMTVNNRRVLDMVEDIRKESSFSRKSVDAEFYINGICLCPKAKLYISEIGTSYSCVMTWRVLRAFETLKNDQSKLTDLPSLGQIQWGGNETYGGSSDETSNLDSVVYPDYDAGVPHEAGTPPKPCVPVFKLIQMINDKFGIKFNIGKEIFFGMGKKPQSYLNNSAYYGKRVYDDYISSGVIPLSNTVADNGRFLIKGISAIGSFFIKQQEINFTQTWTQIEVLHNRTWYRLHYNLTGGTYTGLKQQNSEQLQATYIEPKRVAIGVAKLGEFNGNNFVKPVYGFIHDSGLAVFNDVKDQKKKADDFISLGDWYQWIGDTYVGTEKVTLSTSTVKKSLTTSAWFTGCGGYSGNGKGIFCSGPDSGYFVGVVGFYTKEAFALKGYCNLRIAKAAVDAGRVDVSSYMWICIAKRQSNKKDELELATDKDISKYPGFQSTDIPVYEASTNTYVCHFDFGYTYDARTIEIDSDDSDTLEAYMFVPYYPEDHMKESVLNLEDDDLYFEDLFVSELQPTLEVATLPATINVTDSLPDVTCFNFMKSVFYMNGALPRVERDGETISAVYYNALRDNVNDGNALDWSKKLVASEGEMPSSIKFRNSKFAKVNYLAMASNYIDKTEEEIATDLDQYSYGYGALTIDDDALDATATLFQSCFYPAYTQNLRFPLIKTGKTCKVWEGDKTLTDDVKPIYGIMVYRTLDSQKEDVGANRPSESSTTEYAKRMNVFSPFDDDELMSKLFGYYQAILKDYRLIKEKFYLDEIDLRDFDESKPIYLAKYNTYFAVSTIQRDKSGISTVELVRLPRAEDDSVAIHTNDYKVELAISAQINMSMNGERLMKYYKKSKNSDWEVFPSGQIDVSKEDTIYAITANYERFSEPTILAFYLLYSAQYNYIYTDAATGELKTITRPCEAAVYYDGNLCDPKGNTLIVNILPGDEVWHKVEIVCSMKNQKGEIEKTDKWTSPIIVSSKEVIDKNSLSQN